LHYLAAPSGYKFLQFTVVAAPRRFGGENEATMRRFTAELLGTFVLVFGGVGSAVLAGDKIGNVGVSFAFGLCLLVMVYTIGPISGCHINPAVTVGMLVARKIGTGDAVFYVIAQCMGAMIASALIYLVASGAVPGYDPAITGMGANGFGLHSPGNYSLFACFVAETVLTAFLIFTVLGATDVKAPVGFAGIAIGGVLTLIHLVGIPLTNTSVNPARSLGPAVIVGGWALQQLWLFIVAPLLGAVAAAGMYAFVRVPDVVISTQVGEQALPAEQAQRIEKRHAA
jgi:aquaporin Z